MKKKASKERILSLIKDDLVHMHIIYGLKGLGFHSDQYMLNICSSVFDLMGINMNDRRFESLTDEYMKRIAGVAYVESIEDHDRLEALSLEVYNYLDTVRKMHK